MRRAAVVVGLAVGLYLIGRAVAEPLVIDLSDPATYRDDWGGPSLIGVLLVHSGPGVVAAIAITIALIRHRSSGHVQRKQLGPAVGRNHPRVLRRGTACVPTASIRPPDQTDRAAT